MRRRQRSVGGKIGCGNPGRACTTEGMVMEERGIPPSTARPRERERGARRRAQAEVLVKGGPRRRTLHLARQEPPSVRSQMAHVPGRYVPCVPNPFHIVAANDMRRRISSHQKQGAHFRQLPNFIQQLDFWRSRSPVDARRLCFAFPRSANKQLKVS